MFVQVDAAVNSLASNIHNDAVVAYRCADDGVVGQIGFVGATLGLPGISGNIVSIELPVSGGKKKIFSAYRVNGENT
jgi:hypothetical protein